MLKLTHFMIAGVLALLCTSFVTAQEVTQTEAEIIAVSFFENKFSELNSDISVTDIRVEEENGTPLCYMFQINLNGFVIVSATKNARPVLAYGKTGGEDLWEEIPEFDGWLNTTKKQLDFLIKNQEIKMLYNELRWSNLENGNTKSSLKGGTEFVSPLTSTKWSQNRGYASDCPYGTLTGCVATAMAQVCKYYNYPTKGKGYKNYSSHVTLNDTAFYTSISVNFEESIYDWKNMSNSVTSENPAVAKLMFHMGVSVNSNYGSHSTTAKTYLISDALSEYFGYESSTIKSSNHTISALIETLKAEINEKRVVLTCGTDFDKWARHCFVLDGYDEEDFFHVNWGWGGSRDGYYTIDHLIPESTGYDFSSDLELIISKPPCELQLSLKDITDTTAIISNEGFSFYNKVEYKQQGTSIWNSVGSTEKTINLTGLQSGTTYDYRVISTCTGSEESVSEIFTFTTENSSNPSNYCEVKGGSIQYEWIDSVSIGFINNKSGINDGYADFTTLSTDLTIGSQVNYSLKPGFNGSSYDEIWKVWIDYNQDFDFEDEGELVVNNSSISTINGNFQIPANAVVGITRMRVLMSYGETALCNNPANGEIEDYNVNIVNNVSVNYCEVKGINTISEWIENVSIGSMNNPSGNNSGYGDYTSISSNIVVGESVNYSLTPGYSATAYTDIWKIWIDFNKNGDFEDQGELVVNSSGNQVINGVFNVQNNIVPGSTRMRVSISSNNIGSCNNPQFGEVEDYTVNITSKKAFNREENSILTENIEVLVFPNPNNGQFYVNVSNNNSPATINIYNVNGQLIASKTINTKNETVSFNSSELDSGMYSVQVKTDNSVTIRRVIVE